MKRILLNTAALLAAAVILAALRSTTPSYDVVTGPIPIDVKAGTLAQARTFTVEAGRVRLARKIAYRSFGRTYERETSGLWAVVSATLAATVETTTIGIVSWVDADGLLYAQSRRVEGAPALLTARRLQPGLPQHGLFVFEIPKEATEGAKLYVSQLLDPRLDSQVRVDLASSSGTPAVLDRLDLDDPDR